MSIQSQLDRLNGAKATLGSYLADNGVAVPEGTTIEGMALLLADVIEKQNKITATGILKGDGAGGVTAAVAGTDYLVTAPVTSVDGKTGAVSLSGTYATPANINTKLNRSTNVNAADTNYTTLMARGMSLHSSETTPAVNGSIAWQYE